MAPDAACVGSRDYDLTDIYQVETMFRDIRPDRVIHLAARTGGVRFNRRYNADLMAQNVLMTINVLKTAQVYGVTRLVSVLSSCAFPSYPERPSTEGDLHEGLPYSGNLGYGYAKRTTDIYTRLLWEQYGCRYATVSPVTLYGPHDRGDIETGHVISSLIQKCLHAKKTGGPLHVWGSGDAVRQFVFVEDAARVILQMLDMDTGPETLIVAADEGITIRELAETIVRVTAFHGPVIYDTSEPEGVRVKVLKSERFDRLFPQFQFTPLERGIVVTAQWYLEQSENEEICVRGHAGVHY
jgi:GDP-L-fucose synthase